ncbi:MAG: hypothetical protein ABL874_11635 [Sphingopyxis sp.]
MRLMAKMSAGAMALCAGGAANAATCATSFARSGSIVSATTFTATQTIATLSVADAIGQLHGIAIEGEYDVLDENEQDGSMVWEQRQAGATRAIPVLIAAAPTGANVDVTMTIRMPSGMAAGSNGVRDEMCRLFGQMRGGREGIALAQRMRGAAGGGAITVIDAYMLSNQVARQHNLNTAVIYPRYRNRQFTVTGRMGSVNRVGRFYLVSYDIPQPPLTGSLRPLPGQPDFSISIQCALAPDQNGLALTLRAGQSIRLTGTFSDYDEVNRLMTISGCRSVPR